MVRNNPSKNYRRSNVKSNCIKPFLSIYEAALYTKLPKSTLYFYTAKNRIPHYKLNGRRLYFKIEDLDRFILNPDNKIGKTEQSESTR